MNELENYQSLVLAGPGKGKEITLVRKMERISIFNDDPKLFVSSLTQEVRGILKESEVILQVMNAKAKGPYYVVDYLYHDDDYSYFRIPFRVEENDDDFDLVFRARDFALQGIITYEELDIEPWNKTYYYYFTDATITSLEGMSSINKLKTAASYTELMKKYSKDFLFSWESMVESFAKMINPQEENVWKIDFARVIIATIEIVRFRKVEGLITEQNKMYTWGDFESFVISWDEISKKAAIKLKDSPQAESFPGSNSVCIFSLEMWPILPSCALHPNAKNVCIAGQTKVLTRYLKQDKSDLNYFKGWANGETLSVVQNISLGNNSPKDYRKIEFFADTPNAIYTKGSWGSDAYWGSSINKIVEGDFQNILLSVPRRRENGNDANKWLLDEKAYDGSAVAKMKIYVGFSYFWDDRTKEWYLQILTWMYGESWASASGGGLWVNYGNRIKLSK